jgi:hypothetical protein
LAYFISPLRPGSANICNNPQAIRMYTNVGEFAKNRNNPNFLKYKERKPKDESALMRWLRQKNLKYAIYTNIYQFDTIEQIGFSIIYTHNLILVSFLLPFYILYQFTVTAIIHCVFSYICFGGSGHLESHPVNPLRGMLYHTFFFNFAL